MINTAKKFFLRMAERLLDFDDTVAPTSHIKFLEDYSGKLVFDTDTDDAVKFLKALRKKHLVDDIVVSTLNGSAIASTNGDSVSQAITGAALFNYVRSELPKSEVVLVRSNGWHMIFALNKKLYIIRAASDLSTTELNALAKEIEKFLGQKGLN